MLSVFLQDLNYFRLCVGKWTRESLCYKTENTVWDTIEDHKRANAVLRGK